jgi:hypothetical protein
MKKIIFIILGLIIILSLIISVHQYFDIKNNSKDLIFKDITKGKNQIVFDSIKKQETVLCN